MFSILIPSYNNLNYLKLCIESLEKNSKFEHQIIIHVNEGSDGTLDYVQKNNFDYTYTSENIGMPKALNKASILSKLDYILISHDDFYYCPGWDEVLVAEINLMNHKNYYLSSTMVGAGQVQFDAGETTETFDESKLLKNLENIKTFNFQGTTKCPGLIHKTIWKKVGGWSEEFSPTGGDDTDFAMKLWKSDIRIFKGMGSSLAYHFGSITTRKKNKSLFTYLGSKGNKIFLKKWGLTINFFEKFYLKSGLDNNKKLIFNRYDGPLKNPKKNINYYINLFKVKIVMLYILLFKFKY
ncbi:glycosyltransferase [Candidatus Pelagibacter sp.]|jgi:GT2 family glycosyltransferase|nr:glycosyltransferase [Candidatus Pelagibacter sp.]|tara:strand:- start:111 stop:998 length:888 start_codon:yes stop_codon:yes gene_type:complete